VAGAATEVERARERYEARAWLQAYEAFTAADAGGGLGAGDLELLAVAAYMLGREEEFYAVLERAHHLHLNAGAGLPAARCAF